MLKSVTLSSNGRLPRTYKTYKIVRITAQHSTFNNDFDNRKGKIVIRELPAHIKLL